MIIPTSKKELLAMLAKGSSKNRREVVEHLTDQSANQKIDPSVIDISDEGYEITPAADTLTHHNGKVPHWPHHAIDSYDEIYNATPAQRQFYEYFKFSFVSGKCIDLEGNSNYAFILLFDIFNGYLNHNDLTMLKRYADRLGRNYPSTKQQAVTMLSKCLETAGVYPAAAYVRESTEVVAGNWGLGGLYREKLNLTQADVDLLNRLPMPTNSFLQNKSCLFSVIRFYLKVIGELEREFQSEQTTFEKELTEFGKLAALKENRRYPAAYDFRYYAEKAKDALLLLIFRISENAVRERFGMRKVGETVPFENLTVAKTIEIRFLEPVKSIVDLFQEYIPPPDDEAEVSLNGQNPNRWKVPFAALTQNFRGDDRDFLKQILRLGNLNVNNRMVSAIYFEGAKFIAPHNREAALELYLYYLKHLYKKPGTVLKEFPKKLQKLIFKTDEQRADWQSILDELYRTRNVSAAVDTIASVFEPKRKKIRLNTAAIREVKAEHSGTVSLLNEYLKDDDDEEIKPREEVAVVPSANFELTQIQRDTLALFSKNELAVSQNDLETFARSHGAFKNQLIESINEACFDLLDDVLIEEDTDFFTIDQNYFQQICP